MQHDLSSALQFIDEKANEHKLDLTYSARVEIIRCFCGNEGLIHGFVQYLQGNGKQNTGKIDKTDVLGRLAELQGWKPAINGHPLHDGLQQLMNSLPQDQRLVLRTLVTLSTPHHPKKPPPSVSFETVRENIGAAQINLTDALNALAAKELIAWESEYQVRLMLNIPGFMPDAFWT